MTTRESPLQVLRDGYRLVAGFVRVHPVSFLVAVSGAAIFASGVILSAWVIGRATDQLIIPVLDEGVSPSGLVLPVVLAIVAVAIWKATGIVLRRTGAGWLQFQTRADVRKRLIAHQLRLGLSWFRRQSVGDLLAVSETDASQGTFILAPLPFGTGSVLLLVGTIVVIFALDPILALLTLVALVAATAVDVRGSWKLFEAFQEVQRLRGETSTVAHESFDGALTIKALGREDFETERFSLAAHRLRDKVITVERAAATYRSVVESFPAVTTVLVLTIGTMRIAAGAITPGELVSVAYLLSLISVPMRLIGYVLWDLAESLAGWRRVREVLDADEVVEHGPLRALEDDSGARVGGEDIGFGYDEGDTVISELELDVPPGKVVAMVGRTASGKSTLAVLLARLWDPSTGIIHLDGRDLRSFARSELAREVAFVSQETFLFDDTVRGNITLGLTIPDDEVREAARLAGADEFISQLPAGYDTRIGERGTSLSGGQRQRLALARALVRRPRLLILDDATSAVDPSVEAEILRGLRHAGLPSTVIVVAYRRSSIVLADEVIYIEDGRVVAQGTHRDLLESAPGYARLLRAYDEDAAARKQEAKERTLDRLHRAPDEVRT
jgi:ATP-binding cassette, subfamily B, bacterial